MGQAAVNLWAEEAPENPQPFVYAVSLIKLLLCFSGFVLLRHNALNPTRFKIWEFTDKVSYNGLDLFWKIHFWSSPKPNSANFIICAFRVFVLLPPKTMTIMRSLLFLTFLPNDLALLSRMFPNGYGRDLCFSLGKKELFELVQSSKIALIFINRRTHFKQTH